LTINAIILAVLDKGDHSYNSKVTISDFNSLNKTKNTPQNKQEVQGAKIRSPEKQV